MAQTEERKSAAEGMVEGIAEGMPGVAEVAEDAGMRGLIRAAVGGCSRDDNDDVEDDTKRGHSKDDRRGGDINLPQITRERTAEEQQGGLQHQWQ